MEARGRSAGARAEVDGGPVALRGLHEVGMADVLDGVSAAAVGEDGIPRARFERTPRTRRPRDRDGMPSFGAALSEDEVPVLADPIEVRTFGGGHAAPLPHRVGGFQEATGDEVEGCLADAVASAGEVEHVPGEVARTVFVPREIGVDARRFGDEDRFTPRAGRVFGVDEQVSLAEFAHVGGDEPEAAVVVPERAGVDAGRGSAVAEAKLGSAVEDVADLLPGDQIPAVEDRRSGEILEARRRQVVILTHPADRRIGMKARDDGADRAAAARHDVRCRRRDLRFAGGHRWSFWFGEMKRWMPAWTRWISSVPGGSMTAVAPTGTVTESSMPAGVRSQRTTASP